MDFFFKTSTWIPLFTLIILEIVLSIDNLVFISVLIDKLSPIDRDKARIIGLSLALLIRLMLLFLISWIITLTHPIIQNKFFNLSGRDLILLFGGTFLLFKSTIELHERLEYQKSKPLKSKNYSNFWTVILQIVVLDAIFSLDSVITAVGMVNSLPIMISAVIIAMFFMLLASKQLTVFMNFHPSVVVLCLSFLLMIGISLIAESIGFFIPKGYLYTAISFSILIELFNQISKNKIVKYQSKRPIRQRVTESILRLMLGEKNKNNQEIIKFPNIIGNKKKKYSESIYKTFKDEEKYMINGVLTLALRSIRSIMTPRSEISWVNLENSNKEIRNQLLDTPHSLFPICRGELDEIVGIVRAKELLMILEKNDDINIFSSKTPPIIIPDTLDTIKLLGVLKNSRGSLVIVSNEFGVIQGLITPLDVLEAIAGEFPDADETPEIIFERDGSWLVKGRTDLHSIQQLLNTENLIQEENYASLNGFLISHKGQLPIPGEIIEIPPLQFHILEVTEYRINLVRIKKII
ncbi:MAG TPA: TerC family protein [Buchnera sp. (in: enterobacteria)]|nr:TerC family protein [Buchnera sp. (in: enterobacteria)]